MSAAKSGNHQSLRRNIAARHAVDQGKIGYSNGPNRRCDTYRAPHLPFCRRRPRPKQSEPAVPRLSRRAQRVRARRRGRHRTTVRGAPLGRHVAQRHLSVHPLSFAHPRGAGRRARPRPRALWRRDRRGAGDRGGGGLGGGRAGVRFGGATGEELEIAAGDVAVLPAGTGHQRLSTSSDLLVVGAYPPAGTYDLCRATAETRERALTTIPHVPLPATDPLYGADGPLMALWRK